MTAERRQSLETVMTKETPLHGAVNGRTLTADALAVDIDDFADRVFENGWTDGFPVFPPTEKKIREIIDYLGRDPDEVIGIVQPAEGMATIEAIAINCAMAGCKPEYVPVVVAAVEAITDERFHQLNAQCSTVGGPPLLMISGPVVDKLEFNYAEGALAGSGHRPNGTVARAIRLILWNIGQGKPGHLAKPVFAHPGRWGFLVCERPRHAGNPWNEFHVSEGLSPEDSAVSVLDANGGYLMTPWVRHGANMPSNIVSLAEGMGGRSQSSHQFGSGGTHILMLNPDAAKMIADAGWSKEDLRDAIFEESYSYVRDIKASLDRQGPGVPSTNTSTHHWSRRVDVNDDDAKVYTFVDPSHLKILVSGGFGGGHVSYHFRGGSHSMDGKGLVTKRIDWDWG
jgi:hypothetical protein